MDDQMNQGVPNMPGSVPPPPVGGSMGDSTPPPSGGSMGEGSGDGHPHEQILAALARIEEKLATIAAKVGA